MRHTVFLFGEAEKGEFCTPILCKSLAQLAELLGNPPEGSEGIAYGVQTLLYKRELIFYRVKEEGFSTPDYLRGLRFLQKKNNIPALSALCMPGVGDAEIIEATHPVCSLYQTCLVLTQKDLYDYLTVAQGSDS